MKEHYDAYKMQEKLREHLIGLGERSLRKSYYPELQQRIEDLKRFRALLDQSYDLIFLLELPSGKMVDFNESACQQLGYAREKLLLTPFNIIISESAPIWSAIQNCNIVNSILFREDNHCFVSKMRWGLYSCRAYL